METTLVTIRVRIGSDVFDYHIVKGRQPELYGFNPARGTFDVLMNHLLDDSLFQQKLVTAIRSAGVNLFVLVKHLEIPCK